MTDASQGGRWRREPLIPFALAGALLFGLFALVGEGEGEGGVLDRRVVVTAATQGRIAEQQQRRLGREPSPEELDAAIREWADAELLYREARALELDRGDPIVRRRLLQKMQFVLEEEEAVAEPSDERLAEWIAAHADRFEQAPRVALTHVFVAAPARQREAPEAELTRLEQALAEGADPSTLGEAFVLGQELEAKSAVDLNRQFGQKFGDAVLALEDDGRWHRLRSLYGWHLVHVDERFPGRLAGVDEVRSQAREGVMAEARERARVEALDRLRARYEIVVEGD